jgi:arsenite methyltransferase
MKNDDALKQVVKEKYGKIASQKENSCGCGCGCNNANSTQMFDYSNFSSDYNSIPGYVPEADLGLGCGIPLEFAGIKSGDTVVDLGCGTGNDVFIARKLVGDTGHVIGIDMTEEMIAKANYFKIKFGFQNVDFYLAEIEKMPLENNFADLIVSNCVLNLVPDKQKAFAEIYRILKPGAHFCISDIVLKGKLPENLQKQAELYAGCVAGALIQDEYLEIIKATGFEKIVIHESRQIQLSPAI